MGLYKRRKKTTVKVFILCFKRIIFNTLEIRLQVWALYPQISLPVTEEFRIPLPPLPVQEEIVRILDNFTGYSRAYSRAYSKKAAV